MNCFKKSRILVVDDEPELREVLSDMLSFHGYQVFTANDGQEAIEKLETEFIDLIISDIQMPRLNGIELLKWNKEHVRKPFIIITGFSHLLEAQEAFDLGAKEFISKPFQEDELLTAVENSLL